MASAQGVDDDVVSYDYGSSEDEASVVVRPYEVPNQVPIQLLGFIISKTSISLLTEEPRT